MTETPASRYEQPFRLILPEQKRLRAAFDQVMAQAGLVFEKPSPRAAAGITRDLQEILPDMETYEFRADAALEWVNDGAADLAIVGQDVLLENRAAKTNGATARSILDMNRISKCSLWIAARPEIYIRDLTDLGSMRLATSYPALLQQLLDKQGVTPGRIIAQKGGIESLITAGRADAILEIVQTGNSLKENGLEKKLLAFNSCATLVRPDRNTGTSREALISQVAARLEQAVAEAPQIMTEPADTASRVITKPILRPAPSLPLLANA